MELLLLTAAAYLLGAVPFGLLIGLARGIDIRQHGSRNIGATNTGRVLGKRWGYLCLLLDALKGCLPAVAAQRLLVAAAPVDAGGLPGAAVFAAWLLVGLAAVLGHVFPVYLRFRGGKGVATTIGFGLGVYPYFTVPMLIALGAYLVVRKALGLVSAGSITLALAFPAAFFGCALLAGWSMANVWPLQATALLLAALILVRHAGNIRRMVRGEELRAA